MSTSQRDISGKAITSHRKTIRTIKKGIVPIINRRMGTLNIFCTRYIVNGGAFNRKHFSGLDLLFKLVGRTLSGKILAEFDYGLLCIGGPLFLNIPVPIQTDPRGE